MGIAGAIFWILAGALYILYHGFKEHPNETASGVVLFLIIFGAMFGFMLTFQWITDQSIVGGAVFGIVGIGALVVWIVRSNIQARKDRMEAERKAAEHLRIRARAQEILKDTHCTDEELRAFAESTWVNYAPINRFEYQYHYKRCRPDIEKMYKERVLLYKIMDQIMNGQIQ